MLVVDDSNWGDLTNVKEEVYVGDPTFAFDDCETDSDVGSILGADDHSLGCGAVSASNSNEGWEEDGEHEEEMLGKVQENERAPNRSLRQVMGILRTRAPVETQVRAVSFHDSFEGIVDICSLSTSMAADAIAMVGDGSPAAHCGHADGGSIKRTPSPGAAPTDTPAACHSCPTTPRREPPTRCTKRRVFGAVVRAPAADANAGNVQIIPPEPTLPNPPQGSPVPNTPQGQRIPGRKRSVSLQKRRSSGSSVGVSVGGAAAGLGQKPALRQIYRLDLDEGAGEFPKAATPAGSPREQVQHARPPSIARSYAALGAELHRMDASDAESVLPPPSRQKRYSLPVNFSALEQDCGMGAYAKSSFAHSSRPSTSRSGSASVYASMESDRLPLSEFVGGASTDLKRPASMVPPASARPNRAAKSHLPALCVPFSARRGNLQKQHRLAAVYS